MITTASRGDSFVRLSSKSSPDSSRSLRSMKATSNGERSIRFDASARLTASSTVFFIDSRAIRRLFRILVSSSTIRMRMS